MIAEKDTSDSTASNVDFVRSSDYESVRRHGPPVGNCWQRRPAAPDPVRSSSVAAKFCSLFSDCTCCSPPLSLLLSYNFPDPIMDASFIILLYRYYLFGMPCTMTTKPSYLQNLSSPSSYCHSFQCNNLQRSRMELAHLTEC